MSSIPCCILTLFLARPVVAQNDPWSQSYGFESKRDYIQAAKVLKPYAESNEFAMLRVAYLSYLQGNHEESVRAYKRAFEMNEHSHDALLGMTLPLMALKRWDEASAKLGLVLTLSPWNYTATIRMLVCDEARKNWKSLASLGGELSRRYPSDLNAALYWARGAARLGNASEASKAYQRVIQISPGHQEAVDYLKTVK